MLNLPQCQLVCPAGKTLRRELGASFFFGNRFVPEEKVFWNEAEEVKDYEAFIEPFRSKRDLFLDDGRKHGMKYWIWKLRQKWLGQL